jgi:PST family polysaccharide transporter
MDDVHRRARRGIRLLIGRQAMLHVLAITGGIFVARMLGPGPIGAFGIALFVVTLLGLAADLGMRTALIQQATPPTERQLRTCFTLQQSFSTFLVAGVYVAAPAIATVYRDAPPELASLFRLLAFDLYFRSWRTMSEVRLERELRYGELALADLAASSAFHAVAVGLVLAGWGAQSLVWATLAGSLVRSIFLHHAARWPLRLGVERAAVRLFLRAGLPLQMNEVVARVPAWITPTLVGALIGPHAVGLLTWAVIVGHKPLEMLQNVVRVSLTHFARLQHDPAEVERILVRYGVGSLLTCGLWFAMLAVAGHDLVALVYTERWLPAMPALLIFAASAMPGSLRWLAAAALIATGRAAFTTRVSAVAALVSITASIVLVLHIGLLGVPIGQLAGIAVATPWLLSGLRPTALAGLLRHAFTVIAPVTAAMAAGALALLIPLEPAARGVTTAAIVCLVFIAAAWWTGPPWLRSLVRDEITTPALRLLRSTTSS